MKKIVTFLIVMLVLTVIFGVVGSFFISNDESGVKTFFTILLLFLLLISISIFVIFILPYISISKKNTFNSVVEGVFTKENIDLFYSKNKDNYKLYNIYKILMFSWIYYVIISYYITKYFELSKSNNNINIDSILFIVFIIISYISFKQNKKYFNYMKDFFYNNIYKNNSNNDDTLFKKFLSYVKNYVSNKK